MKFLTLAAALTTAVSAQAPSKTTADIAGLTQAIFSAVPSMYYCQLSAKVYKRPDLGGSLSLSSWESGCAYFESLHVPPVQKALDTLASGPKESLAGIGNPEIQSNLTKLLGYFDDFAANAKGRDADLTYAACQFITGDVQPSGEKVKQKPDLGNPTILMLKTLAEQLNRAGALPELAKKAADYSAKLDAVMKAIRPTCRKGSVSATSARSITTSLVTLITSSPTPKSIGTSAGIPAPSVNGTVPRPTGIVPQPSQPGQPPVPTQIPGGTVLASGALVAPSVMMAFVAAGALLLL